jgi:hypothetical protein
MNITYGILTRSSGGHPSSEALRRDLQKNKSQALVFLFSAKYNYPWRKHIDDKDYTLGTGKRVIVRGEVLDKRYNITIPRSTQENYNFNRTPPYYKQIQLLLQVLPLLFAC